MRMTRSRSLRMSSQDSALGAGHADEDSGDKSAKQLGGKSAEIASQQNQDSKAHQRGLSRKRGRSLQGRDSSESVVFIEDDAVAPQSLAVSGSVSVQTSASASLTVSTETSHRPRKVQKRDAKGDENENSAEPSVSSEEKKKRTAKRKEAGEKKGREKGKQTEAEAGPSNPKQKKPKPVTATMPVPYKEGQTPRYFPIQPAAFSPPSQSDNIIEGPDGDAGRERESLQMLMNVGPLHRAVLRSRPSKKVKTPYVADVCLLPADVEPSVLVRADASGGSELPSEALATETSAHSPALDCSGLIVPGKEVFVSEAPGKGKGKACSHVIQLVVEPRTDGVGAVVGSHPMVGECLAERLLLKGFFREELGDFPGFRKQVIIGKSHRVDFVVDHEDGDFSLVEVKTAVDADFPTAEEGGVPIERHPVGAYTREWGGAERHAIFPHGSLKPEVGVVSERAIKHIHSLTEMKVGNLPVVFNEPNKAKTGAKKEKEKGNSKKEEKEKEGSKKSEMEETADRGDSPKEKEKEKGTASGRRLRHCIVLFLVSRSDCGCMRPFEGSDPLFASVCWRAQKSGVLLLAHDILWTADGRAFAGKRLPVKFAESVENSGGAVDEEHLRRVLDFGGGH
uniref:Uncharacterized protein n=1 Tax=Chromera velia CCMP2878 TaxID=1169474 RepID=A0A0G4HUG1_9ALVE|eukprot:Cvel_8631.t1-p1 / transcript=Cvel_8631.t1 / gene=Cvel_8631 / organism=Chromera_velia_CCMP2878 / gene_product=hypothetical protein / transcript_product=hypothetical protein / location=Cvel_scaffold480:72436-75562(-) / protein_length=621 / sequence_SO=supercontig / SO=protein_coding / is_pseudo=false